MMEERVGLVPPAWPDAESLSFRRVTDLDLWTQIVSGRPAVFIQMPFPEAPPLAYFAGVVLLAPADQPQQWRGARARFFTLERTADPSTAAGILCEWPEDGSHHNFGVALPTKRSNFACAVGKAVELGEQLVPQAVSHPLKSPKEPDRMN